ncbi:MAG: hypothetical protein ACQER2_00250 [Bacillota bacterium]
MCSVFVSILIVLTSCAASKDTAFDTSLKQQYKELDTVESVVTDDVIYVAMIVTPLKQFSEQKIAERIKKDLQRTYPTKDVYTSSDMKAVIEVRRLELPLTTDALEQLKSYDQSLQKEEES